MKRFDFKVELHAGTRRFVPNTERAIAKTPGPVSFTDRAESLAYLQQLQRDGFRVGSADLVDPEQRNVRYGYFLEGPHGQLVPTANSDNGPSDTAYEVGDTLMGGPRNSQEARIKTIITGEVAAKLGFGVVFVITLRDVSRDN